MRAGVVSGSWRWIGGVVAIVASAGATLPPAGAEPPPPQPEVAPPAPVARVADGRLDEILDEHAATMDRLERRVRAARGEAVAATIDRLQALQDELCRAARLDDAVAVRDEIRRLRATDTGPAAAALPARRRPVVEAPVGPDSPARLSARAGESHLFTVTGAATGTVWGTDVYTLDSTLAAAAVHAGSLQLGETGVVRVTVVESAEEHPGSVRHGITSHRWPRYRLSYTIERVGDAPAAATPVESRRVAPIVPRGAPSLPAIPLTPARPVQPGRGDSPPRENRSLERAAPPETPPATDGAAESPADKTPPAPRRRPEGRRPFD